MISTVVDGLTAIATISIITITIVTIFAPRRGFITRTTTTATHLRTAGATVERVVT